MIRASLSATESQRRVSVTLPISPGPADSACPSWAPSSLLGSCNASVHQKVRQAPGPWPWAHAGSPSLSPSHYSEFTRYQTCKSKLHTIQSFTQVSLPLILVANPHNQYGLKNLFLPHLRGATQWSKMNLTLGT